MELWAVCVFVSIVVCSFTNAFSFRSVYLPSPTHPGDCLPRKPACAWVIYSLQTLHHTTTDHIAPAGTFSHTTKQSRAGRQAGRWHGRPSGMYPTLPRNPRIHVLPCPALPCPDLVREGDRLIDILLRRPQRIAGGLQAAPHPSHRAHKGVVAQGQHRRSRPRGVDLRQQCGGALTGGVHG